MKRLLILSTLATFATSYAGTDKAEKAKWNYVEEKLIEAPKANASTAGIKTAKAILSLPGGIASFIVSAILTDSFLKPFYVQLEKNRGLEKQVYLFEQYIKPNHVIAPTAILVGLFGYTITYKLLGKYVLNYFQNQAVLNFINNFWPEKKDQTPEKLHTIFDDAKKLDAKQLKWDVPAIKALVNKKMAAAAKKHKK